MESPPRGGFEVAAIIAVAGLVLMAGLWFSVRPSAPASPSVPPLHPGMQTGTGAFLQVSTALKNRSPRLWELFDDVGVATPAGFTPITGVASDPSACSSLPFPSVWNVSALPIRGGDLLNGWAPFWQFDFQNETAPGVWEFEIGVFVNGTIYLSGPLAESNACMKSLGWDNWSNAYSPGFVPNLSTAIVGPFANRSMHSLWQVKGPYAVLWSQGAPSLVSNFGGGSSISMAGPGWIFTVYRCGLADWEPALGATTAYESDFSLANGTVSGGVHWSYTNNTCIFSNYHVLATYNGTAPSFNGTVTSISLNVTTSPPFPWAVQGLAAWMVEPTLTVNGSPASVANDSCPSWVANVYECPLSSGWLGVLVSVSGEWLDSYGSIGGVDRWAAPQTPILSGDSLILLNDVLPAGGQTVLALDSAVGWPTVTATSVSW